MLFVQCQQQNFFVILCELPSETQFQTISGIIQSRTSGDRRGNRRSWSTRRRRWKRRHARCGGLGPRGADRRRFFAGHATGSACLASGHSLRRAVRRLPGAPRSPVHQLNMTVLRSPPAPRLACTADHRPCRRAPSSRWARALPVLRNPPPGLRDLGVAEVWTSRHRRYALASRRPSRLTGPHQTAR